MRFHLSMNFIAEDCNKTAQKHEPTLVDFTHNWFQDEQIFIGTHINKNLMVIKMIKGYPPQQ